MIDGLSSEDIARARFISVHTVRDHVKAIFAKIGISRRQDLIGALAGDPRPTPAMDRQGTGRGLRECS